MQPSDDVAPANMGMKGRPKRHCTGRPEHGAVKAPTLDNPPTRLANFNSVYTLAPIERSSLSAQAYLGLRPGLVSIGTSRPCFRRAIVF
ncbi:hypothetical protein BC938DRAFT_477529 [Jimgerdemannia flammicorona]|uniref:Uncharacterized protein n=1 Tax=Jimgerdemannia flammicorona TaxID=994334 RepID=A0A433P9D8_9FUNG|nr:hypothetical protein BC938DRAFT_477529 [Jimgerdemannia flammicorona]